MAGEVVNKSVVSISDMARSVGLSRARFYQLVKRGTFPPADQDPVSNRPCYFEPKQRQILEVRRRNFGVDGKPILFYARRSDVGQPRTATRPAAVKAKSIPNKHGGLIDGLAALNVTTTVAQIEPLMTELFPSGTEGFDLGEVIRTVFLRIQRQNTVDKQGR